jgi:hypothetical protein
MRRPLILDQDATRSGRSRDVDEEVGCMGRLMKRIEEASKSPKAKRLEEKMIRKAQDPQTKAKISKRFRKLAKKHS